MCKEDIERAIQTINSLDFSIATIRQIEDVLTQIFEGYTNTGYKFDSGLYINRSRIGNKPTEIKEVSYPYRPDFITEYGRANDIGEAVFYGSVGRYTPFFEIGAEVGNTIMASLWRTTHSLFVNQVGFTDEVAKNLKTNRDLANAYDFVTDSRNLDNVHQFLYNFLASSYTRNVYDDKQLYKLSIAITRKMWDGNLINGIIYPSIAAAAEDDNIILRTSFVDDYLQFVAVEFLEVTEVYKLDGVKHYKYKVLDSATQVRGNGEIIWSGRYLTWFDPGASIQHMRSTGREWIVRDWQGNRQEPRLGDPINPNISRLELDYQCCLPDCFKISQTLNFAVVRLGVEISVNVVLCLSENNETSIAAYFRYCPSEKLVIALLNQLQIVLSLGHNYNIKIKDTDGSEKEVSYASATFSKKVLIFSETVLNTDEILNNTDPTLNLEFSLGEII